MFVPIVDGLLLPLSKAAPAIRAVLAEIPKLFSTNKNVETIVLPTVQAGLDALKVSIFWKNRIGNCTSLKCDIEQSSQIDFSEKAPLLDIK